MGSFASHDIGERRQYSKTTTHIRLHSGCFSACGGKRCCWHAKWMKRQREYTCSVGQLRFRAVETEINGDACPRRRTPAKGEQGSRPFYTWRSSVLHPRSNSVSAGDYAMRHFISFLPRSGRHEDTNYQTWNSFEPKSLKLTCPAWLTSPRQAGMTYTASGLQHMCMKDQVYNLTDLKVLMHKYL